MFFLDGYNNLFVVPAIRGPKTNMVVLFLLHTAGLQSLIDDRAGLQAHPYADDTIT